jgi:hypothetical protein
LQQKRPRVFVLESANTGGLAEDPELLSACELIGVRDVAELERQIALVPAAVVVCEWVDRLARTLERAPHSLRVIHYGATLPEGVLEAIGNGHAVSHAPSPGQLMAQLGALHPVRDQVRWHHLAGLTVEVDGASAVYQLIDLSNEGLSFEVDAADDVEPFLPGAVLERLNISYGDQTVLEGVSALVRDVAVAHGGAYRIGCEMGSSSTSARRRSPVRILAGRALAAGLIRAALQTSGIVLQGNHDHSPFHCTSGTIDTSRNEFTVASIRHALQEYDVVRGHFEVGGSLYRFCSSVVAQAPLRIRIPEELEESRQRGSDRYRPAPPNEIIAELVSPVSLEPIKRKLYDLSSSGLSLDVDLDRDLFPVGLKLSCITFEVAGSIIRCPGTVKNLARLHGHRQARCGIEFEGFGAAERARLAELLTCAQYRGLHDGAQASFDDLLGFFRRSGYLSPEREQVLAPMMPEVRRTFAALSKRPNRLLKSVVCREGDRIVGHISSVRVYRKTYMIQHLAAALGRQAGLVLSLANAEYLIQNTDFEYIKIWFQSRNRFPSRVFGGFARKLQDPQLCNLKAYAHVTLATDRTRVDDHSDIDVIEASGEELAIVEQHFIGTEAPLLLRSDDLTRRGLNLSEVNAAYRKFGLQRRRRVLLAMHKDVPLGFALVEQSSPGLNLFEALNRFSIHMLPAGAPHDAPARRALLATIQTLYRRGGRTQVSGLLALDEQRQYEAIGIAVDAEQSMCVTTHRTQLRRFFEHMGRLSVPRKSKRSDAAENEQT